MSDPTREARRTALFDGLIRDVRYAGRSLRRTPLSALTIVTTVGPRPRVGDGRVHGPQRVRVSRGRGAQSTRAVLGGAPPIGRRGAGGLHARAV